VSVKTDLTAQRLREVFDYNPETGLFTRLTSRGPAKAGELLGAKSNSRGYCLIGIDYEQYGAHRLAWLHVHGEWPKHFIDHIDGNPLNNRIANLRDVPHGTNMENQRQARRDNKATGLLGVKVRMAGRFQARIQVSGETRYLGTFNTPEEAHQAYLAGKRQLHEGCTI
jgi:hypothetical protein